MFNLSTGEWLTLAGVAVAIFFGSLGYFGSRKSVKLRITDLTEPGDSPLLQVRNDGEIATYIKEAAIVSWREKQKEPEVLPLQPTAAAEMAAGETRVPLLDRPLSNGGFVELAFTSKERIQSIVIMEFWRRKKRKAYLRLTMTHTPEPILRRIKLKA